MYLHSFYKLFAHYYDDFHRWFTNWKGIRDAEAALDQALASYVQPDAKILDLGCGTGANIDRLVRLNLPFGDYLGVDQSDHMMAAARRKHQDRANVRFEPLRLDKDQLPAERYDVIVSSWVFSHLQQPESLVRKAFDRLKPGGVLVATFKAERNRLIDTLLFPFYKAYDALPVRRASVSRFPNVVRMDRFWGGWATFVVIQAPVNHEPPTGEIGEPLAIEERRAPTIVTQTPLTADA